MTGYVLDALIKSGEVKPAFSTEDINLDLTDKFVVEFDDIVKDAVKDLNNNAYVITQKYMEYIMFARKSLNREKFIKDISTILNENIANQYCDLLIGYITEARSVYNGLMYPNAYQHDVKDIVLDNYVCTLYELIDIMTVLLVECFDEETVRSWSTKDGALDTITDNFILFINSFRNINSKTITSSVLGTLSTLDIETKRNIIGSIWNCIIDIISTVAINNTVEEQGGEDNG